MMGEMEQILIYIKNGETDRLQQQEWKKVAGRLLTIIQPLKEQK